MNFTQQECFGIENNSELAMKYPRLSQAFAKLRFPKIILKTASIFALACLPQ